MKEFLGVFFIVIAVGWLYIAHSVYIELTSLGSSNTFMATFACGFCALDLFFAGIDKLIDEE